MWNFYAFKDKIIKNGFHFSPYFYEKPVMCCVCVLRPVSVFCILRYVRRECQAFLEVFQEIFPPIDVTLRRVGR